MKKIVCILLSLAMLVSCHTASFAAEGTQTLPSGIAYSDIESSVDAYVKENKDTTAAVSVGIFSNDDVLLEKAYGYTNIEDGIANDSEAVFEWGSCTKLITWVSVMQLVEKGAIDLNTDIREYLPDGFFKNLKYDMPITMLNLMNHNAGWQETATDLFIKDRKDVKNLGDALRYIEPEQINKPGEIVAYSNWGAALAGYIVECVSGQSFSEYVHENIFNPLGMEHTALSNDLSDNPWVYEKRIKENCYTTENESLGTCFYHLSLYPAGAATGTLSDFMKFAQAFIPKDGGASPLFDKADTLDEMLSPSLYYADNETARIYHGFFADELGVPILWHDGGTVGCSSWLALNKENHTGMVIFTNQSGESTYNCGLLPLVFGKYKNDTHTAAITDISGVYVNSRSCFKKYTKLYSLFSIIELSKNGEGSYTVPDSNISITSIGKNFYLEDMGGLKQFIFYATTDKDGKNILQMTGSDYVKINGYGLIAKFLFLLLFVIAALYSSVLLIIMLIKLLKAKKLSPVNIYRTVTNLVVIASLLMFISIAANLIFTSSALYQNIYWRLIVCAVLGLVPVIYTIFLTIKWRKLSCTRKERIGIIVNAVMGLIMTFNVYYWIL